jgi:hypothetical protein
METVMTKMMRIVLGAAVVSVLSISSLHATPYTFVKVADTSTAIPGSTGNFANFYTNSRVSTDGATIVFTGANSSSQVGVYSYDVGGGTLARVADWTTFTNLSEPSVFAGTVGFVGTTSGGQKGIYTASTSGAGLTTIANLSTAMPGGTGNFAAFDAPTLQGGNLAFYGNDSGNSWAGVYTVPAAGGTLTKIADNNTAMPGYGTNFNWLGRPSISGGSVAFLGGNQTAGILYQGIYSAPVSGGTVTRVAAAGMTAPGLGAATFTSPYFSAPATDGTYVAFNASTLASGASTGLWRYKLDGTDGTLVAGMNTAIPGHGATTFSYLWGVSIYGGVSVFGGSNSLANVEGIYADASGTLIKVVEAGDTLTPGGKTVQYAKIYDQSFVGDVDVIAFYATFGDGSAGIYAAEVPLSALGVPEPATMSLLILGGIALLRRRKR